MRFCRQHGNFDCHLRGRVFGFTMKTKSYSEKLRDPRWQKKRLEIMEKSGFKCQACESSDVTLNVHHGRYEFGKSPWEYENESLHCLCESCHESRHLTELEIWESISRMPNKVLENFFNTVFYALHVHGAKNMCMLIKKNLLP